MIKLREWSVVLAAAAAAVLICARSSAAQEFLNERPESNDDPWTTELETSPPRRTISSRSRWETQFFQETVVLLSGGGFCDDSYQARKLH